MANAGAFDATVAGVIAAWFDFNLNDSAKFDRDLVPAIGPAPGTVIGVYRVSVAGSQPGLVANPRHLTAPGNSIVVAITSDDITLPAVTLSAPGLTFTQVSSGHYIATSTASVRPPVFSATFTPNAINPVLEIIETIGAQNFSHPGG